MQSSQTVGLDRNTLPYFVKDAEGTLVPVRFAPLTVLDITELTGSRWAGVLFAQTWAGFAGDSRTFKSVKTTETGQNIEGIVRLGSVPLGSRGLRDSLLEVAPVNRLMGTAPRPLTGVGRVLVSRLVVEGYNSGGNGALFVRLHPDAIGFYQSIDARKNQNTKEWLLPSAQAEILFAATTA